MLPRKGGGETTISSGGTTSYRSTKDASHWSAMPRGRAPKRAKGAGGRGRTTMHRAGGEARQIVIPTARPFFAGNRGGAFLYF